MPKKESSAEFIKNANIANIVLAVPSEINQTNEICNLEV